MAKKTSPNRDRVEAFKSAMLNTCVRIVRDAFEGLTLSNCMESVDFRDSAAQALEMPLFTKSIEPAMETARLELLGELVYHD